MYGIQRVYNSTTCIVFFATSRSFPRIRFAVVNINVTKCNKIQKSIEAIIQEQTFIDYEVIYHKQTFLGFDRN